MKTKLLYATVLFGTVFLSTAVSKTSFKAGFIIAVIVLVFTAIPKLPKFNGLAWYIVVVLLVWLFKMLLGDLVLIVTTSFVGYVVSLIFKYYTNKNRKFFEQYWNAILNKEVYESKEEITLNSRGGVK